MKIMNKAALIIVIIILIVFQGCATVLQPGPDMIAVNSNPKDALVKLDDLSVGSTPLIIPVHRSSECIITIEKAGYKTVVIDRDKVLAGWFFPGNLLWSWGFPIAMIIDLASANQGKYNTDVINVDLVNIPIPGSDSRHWEENIETNIDIILPERNFPRISIALTGLRHRGITEEEAAIITDILRRKFFQTDYFQVTDKATMKIVLEQQNFQMSDCSDQACSIEIGRLLDVAKVAFGSVSKLGHKYILEVAVADVETGELIAAEGCELICEIEEIPNLAGCAAGKIALHFAQENE